MDRIVVVVATGLTITFALGSAGRSLAVGLRYVDGLPGSSFGETPNIFRSNGTSLGSPGATDVLNSETFLATDNAWGWRDFGATNTTYDPTPGVVDTDYSSVYESSGGEDVPEIQMRLTSTNGVAASTSYDVYVVYWSDISTNWNIRAGFQPGTTEAPLQVFGNYTTTIAGELPGVFGSSAAWDVFPLDNPTDENNPGATDNNTNPFLDFTPGGPANSARNMLLGRIGTITSGSQAGAAANEIRVWINDLPGADGNRRSWFDGLAFVPAGNEVLVTAQLDRDSGNLTVHNTTSQPFTIVGYSITSAAGALNGSGVNNAPWLNLTANTLPSYTDTDNDWTIVGTPSAFSTELREQDGGLPAGAQDGIVLAANDTLALNLGNVWQRSPFEDIQVLLRVADGTPETFDDNPTVTIVPTYSGTALQRGDFTGNGAIDVQDYISLMQNLHKPQGTLTRTNYYRNGDFNDDNVIDRNDFFLFRTAYLTANAGGEGSFAAMVAEAAQIMSANVPEPSSLLLVAFAGCFCSLRSRRQRNVQFAFTTTKFSTKDLASMNHCSNKSKCFLSLVVVLFVGLTLVSVAHAVPVVGWQCDMTTGNCDDDSQILNANTNNPTAGLGGANSADDFTIWGATPSNVHLDSNFQAVLNGRIRFVGSDPANGRDFRWGMWKRVENGDPDETHSWLGYLAAAGSGGTPGRLYVRNPDSPDFADASFISTQGDASVGTASGPAPTAGPGSQFTDFNNEGTSAGRYFLLAEPPVNNGAAFTTGAAGQEVWYTFEIRVGRYGNEVDVSGSLVADPISAPGDYNDDGAVNAADYTVWRDKLGQPATNLDNRNPANMAATINTSHYDDWKANFGDTGGTPYELRLGGGLDFDGRPAPALDANMMPVPYTSHLTFDFDRVGFLFGNQMNADQVNLEGVDISVSPIETLDLEVNTTNGQVRIRNQLATPFQIDYYEVTSTLGILESDNWQSLDAASGGLPVTNDYLTGWDVAESSSDFVLSEGNFVGSTTIATGSPINLGSVFKTSTPIANRDIRFFAGVAGGGVIRGTVSYVSSFGAGGLSAVPEPSSLCLLLVTGATLLVGRRR